MNPKHRLSRIVVASLITASSLLTGSCSQQAEPEIVEPPPMVVENTELRLRLAGVPGEFMTVTNDGDHLILSLVDPAAEGEVLFANKPPEAGQNLPAELRIHQELIEEREGGDYLGAQELTSQLGTTYYSRGRYLLDGIQTEETTIFALHPYADRIMTISYRYPAGDDSSERVQQLFEVLAVVEGLD
jgi:hypothetical protein